MILKLANLTRFDRFLRLGSGVALMVMGWTAEHDGTFLYSSSITSSSVSWMVSLRLVGLYPLITGLFGWCPIKSLIRRQDPSRRE